MAEIADVIVIGAGPGGYAAAIRAAELGRKVTLIDRRGKLGGVSLHHGCIPSKALVHASEVAWQANHLSELGINSPKPKINFKKMQSWKNSIVSKLSNEIKKACDKNGVNILEGTARFTSPSSVEIQGKARGKSKKLQFNYALIDCGTKEISHPKIPIDGTLVIGPTQAVELTAIPKDLVIVGAGYIGVELGTVYAKLGSRVSLLARAGVLSNMDKELVSIVQKRLIQLGVRIYDGIEDEQIQKKARRALVKIKQKGKTVSLPADKILMAIGRAPFTKGLGLENTKVKLDEKGFIQVDAHRRTADSKIYAIGDITGPPLLAYKASKEGIVAAEAIVGLGSTYSPRAIPYAVFCDPELATVGLSESEARAKGFQVITGKCQFSSLAKALTINQPIGFVKVIAERYTRKILGVQIVGPDASDLISEAALALEMNATLENIANTIHTHPTLPEALMEACRAAPG
ncbi:Dihydrolipoyl dehydrogenase [Candidatus Gugararchaeum adminiculabundum]|nr:Dihydrolipoyl dehydrogenase [Candidatus Gugararchaeum adminiculabundum]